MADKKPLCLYEGSLKELQAGDTLSPVSDHEAAVDPHPGYALESTLGTAAASNTWYVDSVSGADTNTGRSPSAPLRTVAALIAQVKDFDRVLFARNGRWREEFRPEATGKDPVGLEVGAYGTGPLPIFDGADIADNGSFAVDPTHANVYTCAVTLPGRGTLDAFWPGFWENGTYLAEVKKADADGTEAGAIAMVQATPGSFYIDESFYSGSGAGTFTYYIHPTDSSDPASNGKLYEYRARQYPIRINHATIEMLRSHRSGRNGWDGAYNILRHCMVTEPGHHGFISGNSQMYDCISAFPYPRGSAQMIHGYIGAGGPGCYYERCLALVVNQDGTAIPGSININGFDAHTSGMPVAQDKMVYKNCKAVGANIGFATHDTNTIVLLDCETADCRTPFTSPSDGKTIVIGGKYLRNTLYLIGGDTQIRNAYIHTYHSELIRDATIGDIDIDKSIIVIDSLFPAGNNYRLAYAYAGGIAGLSLKNSVVMTTMGAGQLGDLAHTASGYDIGSLVVENSLLFGLPNLSLGGVITAIEDSRGSYPGIAKTISYDDPLLQGNPADGGVSFSPNSPVFDIGTRFNAIGVRPVGHAVWVAVGTALLYKAVSAYDTTRMVGGGWSAPKTLPAFDELFGVGYVDDSSRLVAVGNNGTILTSTSPDIWAASATPAGLAAAVFRALAATAGVAVIVGDAGAIARSTDGGSTWAAAVSPGTVADLKGVAFGAGLFVAVGTSGKIATSADGDTWTEATSGAVQFNDIVWDGAKFVAVGNDGLIKTSVDGLVWVTRASHTLNHIVSVASGDGYYVAVCQQDEPSLDQILRSVDGTTWEAVPWTGYPGKLTGIAHHKYVEGLFVAVGWSKQFAYSHNGEGWGVYRASLPQGSVGNLAAAGDALGLFVAQGML